MSRPLLDLKLLMRQAGERVNGIVASVAGLNSPDDTPATLALRTHNPEGVIADVEALIHPLKVNATYDDDVRPALVVFGTPGCG